ncbi:TPA: phage tail protein, partial [Yersinia enterocolitica]|nr:phage tail protein [Yersinia enterocolitica]HDL6972428.1 phage tail protein [Yersinia enterocolitica]HDL6988865.1 phage tail protein [Yersinia enterocolitica]HDL6997526.1 phage tail protein [Yersinia enterocolitica]HDL7096528.1 phage tail protein [Yersinia enterocolitica]
MDRQIVYPGAIPLETDLLNTNRFTMIAIAKLAASVMGSNTYLNGLACTASSPASMVINIAPGEIYSLQNIDSTAYSSLPADTAHSILKQGILLSATSFTLAAPSIAGQSINYLIQVAFQDVDSGATVLPYYNASNPSQAYSGPNNSGIAQNTIRSGVCSVSVKTGVSATTGSQVTPSPDAGYVGAYVVTVNQGQTTITSTSINLAPNAPFLPKNGLVSGIQSNTMNYSADTGTANNYVASYFPAVTQLTDGLRLTFKAKNSNTASSTFSPNGLASAPIYTRVAGALTGGEIAQNKIMEVEWNSTLSAWTLISGSDPLALSALQKSANLSDLASPQTALTNLGLTGIGIGLPSQTSISNFDFQNFVFTSGGNYLAVTTNWLNAPAGVSYPTALAISITVDYITVSGGQIGLTLVPNTAASVNFKVYKVLCVGAPGSRVFTVR